MIETIDKVLEHPYEGEMFEIETMHSFDKLKVTDEHPVLGSDFRGSELALQ